MLVSPFVHAALLPSPFTVSIQFCVLHSQNRSEFRFPAHIQKKKKKSSKESLGLMFDCYVLRLGLTLYFYQMLKPFNFF